MGCLWYPAHAHSGVAQLAERRTVNPQVVGSIPTPGATNMQFRVGLSGPALFASKVMSHIGDTKLPVLKPRNGRGRPCRPD